MNTSRREWLKQSSFAAFGLGLSLKSMGNEEGLLRSFGKGQGLINLGSNENPYGISPMAKQAIMEQISESNRYQYNVNGVKDFKTKLGSYLGVAAENLLVTAGSIEGLTLLGRYFTNGNIVTATPTYATLPATSKRLGVEVKEVALTNEKAHDLVGMLSAINSNTQLVMVVNPANPTATMIKPPEVRNFCEEASKKTTVLVDEAYIDFLDAPDNESMVGLVNKNPNILVIRTFSKIHGMAGLRIGYIVGHPSLIKKLEEKYFNLSHFQLSNLSMAAALASLQDEGHRESCKQKNAAARKFAFDEIKKLNYRCYPSYTNFIFFHLGNYSGDFSQYMLKQNIILRSNDYPDGKWCRVSVGTMEEMKQFSSVLKGVVS
jgi:histidinol-phosphate aminotransferase